MMIPLDQRSPEWFELRLGCVTASNVSDLMTEGKSGGLSIGAETYLRKLLGERITGVAEGGPKTMAMVRGGELESEAIAAYSMLTGSDVDAGNIFFHDEIPYFCASPDGLVGDDGLVEVKCRTIEKYIDVVEKGEIPKADIPQLVAQMACTGRKWCDYVIYNPSITHQPPVFFLRLDRDDAIIADMCKKVRHFIDHLDIRQHALVKKMNHCGFF